MVALAQESEGVLGRFKSEGETSSVLLPSRHTRQNPFGIQQERQGQTRGGAGLGKDRITPISFLLQRSLPRGPFCPARGPQTQAKEKRGLWGSGKGHLGSLNSNNVSCLCQEGPKYFVFFLIPVIKHRYFNPHFVGKLVRLTGKR